MADGEASRAPAEGAVATAKPRKREYYPDATKAWKRCHSEGPLLSFRPGRDIVTFGAITMRPQSDGYMAIERDIARMSQYLKATPPPPTLKGRIFRQDGEDGPGDKYEIASMVGGKHPMSKSAPVWSFPKSSTKPRKMKSSGVGPGQYNAQMFDKATAPEYSMRPARREKGEAFGSPGCSPMGPLPPAPKILRTGHRPNSMPDWSMRGRLDGPPRPDLFKAKSVPGPGTYKPRVYDDGRFRRPASFGFGASARF